MVEATDIVIWAAAFVALWWVIDWAFMRQDGERLPMRRAPMRVLADVLPKLWRNKSFMLALLCLWLIGAAVAGVQGYFFRVGADPTLSAPQAPIAGALPLSATVPALLARELPAALPRLVEVPLGTWGAMLFAVLLIAAMVRIIIDPPEQIGEETARKLRWPVGLVVAGLAGSIAMVAAPRGMIERLASDAGALGAGGVAFTIGTMVLLPALLAPAYALLWRLALEIARDGVWSFVSSMRALAESWLPITLLIVIASALRPVASLAGGYMSAPGYVWLALLVLLALAPWAILDRRATLPAGLRRSWALFRQKPVDVIAFGLRFTLLFAVLGAAAALFEAQGAGGWAAWYSPLLGVVRDALLLLQALVLARLYVHLSELLESADACAGCPAAER
ncbi:MAG: hypothetical protein ACOX9R_14795 [Armatimonadota bacterium]|jgi:hypothetical protein